MAQFTIPRKTIPVVNEPYWVKFHAPAAGEAPVTPDQVAASVPVLNIPRNLLNRVDLDMWDGVKVRFFTIASPNFPGGRFPAETVIVTQGQVVHSKPSTKTGTHTIHWHGIEPTPMNDGVGHPSMELGEYTYQWQPNFPGTYFYHCHKNTVLHFEAGLYGLMVFDPIGKPHGFGGRAGWASANLPGFPGFVAEDLTVPFDVEAAWVVDDVDPVWHRLGATAFEAGPGVDGPFTTNGIFYDYNPKYFFVTGHNVAGPFRGSGTVPPGLTVGALTPGEIGVDAGVQISVNANVGQNVLIRLLDAAYGRIRVTLNGFSAKCIAADGRSFGIPPYGYNAPFDVVAGVPFELTTARRWDLIFNAAVAGTFDATVEIISNQKVGEKQFTITIPVVINP